MNSLYGNFRTRKFCEIYDEANDFLADYKASGIYDSNTTNRIADASVKTLFYLLYARYGNSNIASSDETQFAYKMWAIIFQYGPTWEKRLDVQNKVRALTDAELLSGSSQINNHSYNPSTAPATDAFSPLTTVNEQTGTLFKKSKMEAYALLMTLLDTDVTEEFLGQFKKLFLTIVEPELPLWYVTELEEGEEQ